MTTKTLFLTASAFCLVACGGGSDAAKETTSTATPPVSEIVETVDTKPSQSLTQILNAQPDTTKARYQYRHPKETLEFFGIEPGMTVAEALPGGGWYSKIILPHLGDEGKLIGVDYSIKMWPEFGGFATPEFVETKKTWPATWTEGAMEWRGGFEPEITAFAFGDMPGNVKGEVDAALFIRALHNIVRFEEKGGYLTEALKNTHDMLKPGGIVGVVQHRAPESSDDAWADGNNGYLKQSFVIAEMEKAGFKLMDTSEINANPKDKPTSDDVVWRLPPTLGTSKDKPDLKAKMEAIGESDRMTLKFVKE